MTDVEAELRRQLTETFESADYPVADPFELIPHLPDGPTTEFRAGDVTVPAIELGMTYAEYQDYPYRSVDALVDDLLEGFEREGVL